mgnify:CR=1 FL=1
MQAQPQDPARLVEVAQGADQGDDEAENEKRQELDAKFHRALLISGKRVRGLGIGDIRYKVD